MKPRLNPSITPEHYHVGRQRNNPVIKGLFISFDINVQPQIVTDTSTKILTTIFKEEKPYPIFFKDEFHMYVSPMEQLLGKYINSVATFLVRQKNITYYGSTHPDVVCGSVLILGTKNIITQLVDNKDYSVPYPIVEEVVRIYDIEKRHKVHR